MNTDFWAGKRVLITGHTGFKGSWLALILHDLGAEVCGYGLPATPFQVAWNVFRTESGIQEVLADLCELDKLTTLCKKFQPQVIIHLAAQAIVKSAALDPIETVRSNVLGTSCLFQAATSSDRLECLLVVSTDKVYRPTAIPRSYVETDALGGTEAYSSSKVAMEEILQTANPIFSSGRRVPVAVARAGNVIGPGDFGEDRLIPDIFRSIEKGSALQLRNPTSTRPWQHLFDLLAGYLSLVEKVVSDPGKYEGAYNFSNDSLRSNTVELVGYMQEQLRDFGINLEIRRGEPTYKEEHSLQLDSSKARSALGHKPIFTFQNVFDDVIDFNLAHIQGESSELLLKRARRWIKRYTDLAGDAK